MNAIVKQEDHDGHEALTWGNNKEDYIIIEITFICFTFINNTQNV